MTGARADDAPGVPPKPTGDRVLLIGIDAATWDVMRPLMAAGDLPHISRLVAEGWSGTLMSMEPTLSPAIWTSIATGKRPAQHGIEGFLVPDPATGEDIPVTSNLRRAETLWTIASRNDRRVNVVGWYVSWPAEKVNGIMVADRFTPESRGALVGSSQTERSVYPPERAPELEALFVHVADFLDPGEREEHELTKVYPVDLSRTRIARRIMDESPADLTMVYLWGIDRVQHIFWKYYQPERWVGPPYPADELAFNRTRIPDYYRDTDELIGRLIDGAGPRDTIMIVSDHGAGPVTTYDPEKEISGDHRIEGIIIAAGNHIRPGRADPAPSVLDVAPTVLYLLGLPVGDDMSGHVITNLVDPAFLAANPVRRIPTYEPAERPAETPAPLPSAVDRQIKDRLRTLGYIE
jgi:predicted AlkP superfamily phosphohydrolase/phosphomutase